MKQLSIPGTRKFQPGARLHGDEALRQHMRQMRKAMKMDDQASTIRAKIAEHQQEIERKKSMLSALVQQAQQAQAAFQEQANDMSRDMLRREGAITQLMELLPPVPPDAPAVETGNA